MRAITTAGLVAAVLAGVAAGQGPAKPGAEYERLKALVGEWTLTMTAGGAESKGTTSYKMGVGGMWLMSHTEAELFGQKFAGHGMDSYDATKKRYVSVWVDSMSGSPVVTEGTYDAAKKTLTMTGTGPGHDGAQTKYKSVSEMPDADTINFTMYMGDGKDPAFTIKYKRKK